MVSNTSVVENYCNRGQNLSRIYDVIHGLMTKTPHEMSTQSSLKRKKI